MRNLAVFLQWCCMDHFIRKSVLQPMLFPHLCSITQNQQVNVMGLWCLWKKEISCSQKKKKKTNCKALYTITTIDLQFSFHCTTVSAQHVFQVALNSQYSQSFCFKLHLSPPPPVDVISLWFRERLKILPYFLPLFCTHIFSK